MSSKTASAILTALLYTQGLLGFAGLATVVLKDWAKPEPVFVVGLEQVDEAATR